jgi:hypothetical protein
LSSTRQLYKKKHFLVRYRQNAAAFRGTALPNYWILADILVLTVHHGG